MFSLITCLANYEYPDVKGKNLTNDPGPPSFPNLEGTYASCCTNRNPNSQAELPQARYGRTFQCILGPR